jgi:N-acetylglucosaminyldiphosphoundecaprenol N-acetyl-beta-D-mannosaminyltransferase
MRKQSKILGINIDNVTFEEAMQRIWDFLKEDVIHMIFTPNSEMLMVAQKDSEMKKLLNEGNLVVADGIGVVLASKILGNPIKERVAGFDIATTLVAEIQKRGYSLYLFGGMPGVAEVAKKNLEKDYPDIKIVGTSDGYFSNEEEEIIIDRINQTKPDIIFVCLGMSRQEKWIYNSKNKLDVKVCIGVGGTLDVFAGKVKRAPEFFCKFGLEWLYRLSKEPWRFMRMMALPKFVMAILYLKIKMLLKGE